MTVVVNILRFLALVAWLAAAVFLGTESPSKHSVLRVIAAVIVGFPGALALAGDLGRFVGAPSARTKERVKHILQSALVDIYREGFYGDDITQLSLHVWMLPMWYRTLVPLRFRNARRDNRRLPTWTRPALTCLATHRFGPHEPAGVKFHKGIGLVGRCIDLGQPGYIHSVRFDTKEFKDALDKDEADWRAEKVTIHQNLKLSQAQRLAAAYSQAAALVIRETSGEAIGCITIELPPDCQVHFRNPTSKGAKDDPLLKRFRSTASHVQSQVQRRFGE
jgi:hypothetical protein